MVNEYTRTYQVEGKDVNTLEARIYYALGGMNYFTYEDEPRGYYFSLTPFEVSRGWRSYKALSGAKTCVLPCNRQSRKRYEEARAMMDDLLAEHLEPFCANRGIELLSTKYIENERER